MMNCEQAQALLDQYMDGTLDENTMRALSAHLAECEECSRLYQMCQDLQAEEGEVPDGFSSSWRQAVRKEEKMEQKAYIIGEETVRKYLTAEDVIDICEKTWRWYGEGKVVMPNKITTDMSSLGVAGWFNSMPAYIAPLDTAGLKLVGGYDGNKALGLPYIKANVVLTDPRTGILKALVSGDYINDARTGAQPAIMTKLLAVLEKRLNRSEKK